MRKDQTGYPIPDSTPNHEAMEEVMKSNLRAMRGLLIAMTEMKKFTGPVFREVDFSRITDSIEIAIAEMERGLSYAVCPTCQGHPDINKDQTCRMCRGKGMISKLYWDIAVPAEIKEIRKKGAKK